MFSRFFIDRPILASVPSIMITLVGLAAVFTLPVAQYPEVTPPTVRVSCTYSGASAQVVADTVAAPIEQQVNGVEDMLYMSSQSSNDGTYQLTVTFKVGTNLNMAQVLVQNRVNLALPQLPDIVKQVGVTTIKRSPDLMLFVSLYCDDGRDDQLYLSNYAMIYLRDELARLEGVGEVIILGQRDYSMRVWLDPDRLNSRGITASDVTRAWRAERPGGGRSDRPAAGHQGRRLPIHDEHPGPPDPEGAVRGHRGQDRQRRADHPPPRPGPGRTRLEKRGRAKLHRRQALRGRRRLPVAGLQRPGHRQAGKGQDGRTREAVSRGAQARHVLRHHALHQRVDQ